MNPHSAVHVLEGKEKKNSTEGNWTNKGGIAPPGHRGYLRRGNSWFEGAGRTRKSQGTGRRCLYPS